MYLTDRKASGKIYQAKNRLSPFLGTFKKLGKATISFVISVCLCPSVRMEQLGPHWKDFH
jgi:hypothetical protein